ncbi:MAG: 3-deoxy-D-manno-octulosonic acid transferase, partial [Brevundimonas sp.]
LILPQDEASASRIAALGGRVDGEVNLKLSGGPLPHDKGAFARISAAIGDRPVVVAASTHPGEELFLVRALDALSARVCLVLLPRHPERGGEVSALLTRDGYAHAVRSRGEALTGDTDIYLADTLGEMGLFLRLADVVIMGGSFAPLLHQPVVGGHNPLEPARLAKPVLSGPDAANWGEVAATLKARHALAVVRSPSELAQTVESLLADPAQARAMGERAKKAAAEAGAGLDRLITALGPLLPPAAGRRR